MGRRLDAKASASLVVAAMEASGLRRGYLVFDPVSRRMRPSHSMFQPLADEVSSNGRDFNGHEAVFWQSYESTLLTATIHKTLRGQAAGGVRKWEYSSLLSAIEDGMRLSQGMGRKNSLAGLWWGGGKGVILSEPGLERKDLYRAYGQFVSSLNGAYVTAEDAGSTPADISEVFRTTRFTTCIPTELGGSGNPSVTTATGVVCGMEAGAFHVDGSGLEGKTVAVQGCGNVARYMFADLLKRGVGKIVATDISSEAVTATRELIGNDSRLTMKVVEPNDNSVLFEDADIVSPCALGGVLNALTIPNIKAKIVCGAANNQLLDESTDDKLLLMYEKVYVPDFLANRMGIVNCANEQYGYVTNDDAIQRHFSRSWSKSIYFQALEILSLSEKEGISSSAAAIQMADELSLVHHPIMGARCQKIIASLVDNKWDMQ